MESLYFNILTTQVEGETVMIPSEIMQHSIAQKPNVDLAKSLEVLASPGKPVSEIPGCDGADHVVRLVGDVFRLTEVPQEFINIMQQNLALFPRP